MKEPYKDVNILFKNLIHQLNLIISSDTFKEDKENYSQITSELENWSRIYKKEQNLDHVNENRIVEMLDELFEIKDRYIFSDILADDTPLADDVCIDVETLLEHKRGKYIREKDSFKDINRLLEGIICQLNFIISKDTFKDDKESYSQIRSEIENWSRIFKKEQTLDHISESRIKEILDELFDLNDNYWFIDLPAEDTIIADDVCIDVELLLFHKQGKYYDFKRVKQQR